MLYVPNTDSAVDPVDPDELSNYFLEYSLQIFSSNYSNANDFAAKNNYLATVLPVVSMVYSAVYGHKKCNSCIRMHRAVKTMNLPYRRMHCQRFVAFSSSFDNVVEIEPKTHGSKQYEFRISIRLFFHVNWPVEAIPFIPLKSIPSQSQILVSNGSIQLPMFMKLLEVNAL